jgi:hypothetical protein
MLVNRPTFTLRGFLRFLDGGLPPAATAMRLHGPGAGAFEPAFQVTWRELPWGT